MQCSDIDLKLGGEQGAYFVELINSPVSKRSEKRLLDLPDDIHERVARVRTGSGGRHDGLCLGKTLFSALFPRPIAEVWHEARGFIGDGGILRLRLDVRANELMNIPWELVHDGGAYRALSQRTPIIRYLHKNASRRRLEIPRPPNVLVVTASPNDLPLLPAIENEIKMINEVLSSFNDERKVGRFRVLENATSSKLHAALQDPYDVVHFMGHGAFRDQRGYLILEDEAGDADLKEAETIGDLLRNTAVQLLVLNACETAIPSPDESLIGVAHAAHAAGIPAVIAMQQPILDQVAAEFARAFYQAFVSLKPLETCLSAGRIAIKAKQGNDSVEWANPVMFSNAPAGSLCSFWDVSQPEEENQQEQEEAETNHPVAIKTRGVVMLGGKAENVIGNISLREIIK